MSQSSKKRFDSVFFRGPQGIQLHGFVISSSKNGWHTIKMHHTGNIYKRRTNHVYTKPFVQNDPSTSGYR